MNIVIVMIIIMIMMTMMVMMMMMTMMMMVKMMMMMVCPSPPARDRTTLGWLKHQDDPLFPWFEHQYLVFLKRCLTIHWEDLQCDVSMESADNCGFMSVSMDGR